MDEKPPGCFDFLLSHRERGQAINFHVRDLTQEEREKLAPSAVSDAQYLKETGVPQLYGEPGYSADERVGSRPTLEINGMSGGYTGEGFKTVISG